MSLKVSALYCFPVKSMGGESLQHAIIDRFGVQNDRRWMLVDASGKFLTQRQCANMVHLTANYDNSCLTLTHGAAHTAECDRRCLEITRSDFQSDCWLQVRVWQDQCDALVANDRVNQWVSNVLGRSCRLVYMPDTVQRFVDTSFAKSNETVSFADGFPLLLATDESLGDFNRYLSSPIEMLRFRPNLVISGGESWAEDQWQTIRVGEMVFDIVKPCSRCAIPTINRKTANKEPEVFKALKQYRAKGNDVYFGQNLLPRGEGTINVGDKVEVLK